MERTCTETANIDYLQLVADQSSALISRWVVAIPFGGKKYLTEIVHADMGEFAAFPTDCILNDGRGKRALKGIALSTHSTL